MNFPVELERKPKTSKLMLYVSSLPIFGGKPIVVPEGEVERLGSFSLTAEFVSSVGNYTLQEIEAELKRLGKKGANAYRVIRKREFTEDKPDKPYRKMETTTFQAYRIPENLAQKERKNSLDLARSCTS